MNRALALAVVAALAAPAVADDVYFSDLFNPTMEDGFIRRSNTDGADPVVLAAPGGGLLSLQVDRAAGKMYWGDWTAGAIRRANLDGSDQEDLVTGLPYGSVLRLDLPNGKLYWGDQVANEIRRVNLDGSENELVVTTPFHRGLAIDDRNDKIYWSTSITMYRGEIKRCDFDGTHIETVVTSQAPEFKPCSIALDTARGMIYWTDYVVDVVQKATLDGDDQEFIFGAGGNLNPDGIALDLEAQKVYWGQTRFVEEHVSDIKRMNFDGSKVETVVPDVGLVHEIVVVPAGPDCYADYDGNGALDLFDFLAYVNAFNAGEDNADCTEDGARDLFDFLCFVNAFNAGC
jgi:hypothetical protein